MITLRLAVLIALMAPPAWAAGPKDPDWPCIQRRQPAMSVAQIWSGPPIPESAAALAQDPDIRAAAQDIALRRTPLAEAETKIRDYAASHPPEDLQALFLATFEHLQSARARVLSGITRYAHKQAALDAEINTQRRQFETLMAAEPQDFDAIDKVEVAIDWSTRIFVDRQQSLVYVCETPVILEQRAFALARVFAAALQPK